MPGVVGLATKTRLEQTRIVAAANESAGRPVIRSLRILAPGAVPVPEPANVDPEPAAAPAGPAAEAVERQTAAMRELSCRAFPEPDTAADDEPVLSTPRSRVGAR